MNTSNESDQIIAESQWLGFSVIKRRFPEEVLGTDVMNECPSAMLYMLEPCKDCGEEVLKGSLPGMARLARSATSLVGVNDLGVEHLSIWGEGSHMMEHLVVAGLQSYGVIPPEVIAARNLELTSIEGDDPNHQSGWYINREVVQVSDEMVENEIRGIVRLCEGVCRVSNTSS